MGWFAAALMHVWLTQEKWHANNKLWESRAYYLFICLLNLRPKHECSAPLPWMMQQTWGNHQFQHAWHENVLHPGEKKVAFLIFDVSSCLFCMFWLLLLLLPRVYVENSSSTAKRIPKWSTDVFSLPVTKLLPLSTLVKHKCFSSCCGFFIFFSHFSILFFFSHLIPYIYICMHIL